MYQTDYNVSITLHCLLSLLGLKHALVIHRSQNQLSQHNCDNMVPATGCILCVQSPRRQTHGEFIQAKETSDTSKGNIMAYLILIRDIT